MLPSALPFCTAFELFHVILQQKKQKPCITQVIHGFCLIWCRWPDSNRHALRHLILSHLLHTEYRRTRPPAEVVDGHQKALPILLFLKLMCKKLRFVCHFRSFRFGRKFWILEGHRRDVAHKQSTTAHAIDSFVANTL